MVPGRYKDYISTPKQNDYRSIHTTVIGPKSQRVELQIRTRAMDDIAEYGIAAHAHYKELGAELRHGTASARAASHPRLAAESGAYQWLRRTIELLAEGDSPEEFLEHTKLELFQDQVFCFTPKGRLIACRGARRRSTSPTRCTRMSATSAVGAKINGRMAPLLHELANGDEVEIARSDGASPPAAWESLVVTGKARAAIRRATRSAVRRQYAGLGRQILDRAFERAGKSFTTTSCAVRCRGSPAPRSRTCSRRSDAARCSRATSCAASTPTTRTSGGPAGARSPWSTARVA